MERKREKKDIPGQIRCPHTFHPTCSDLRENKNKKKRTGETNMERNRDRKKTYLEKFDVHTLSVQHIRI